MGKKRKSEWVKVKTPRVCAFESYKSIRERFTHAYEEAYGYKKDMKHRALWCWFKWKVNFVYHAVRYVYWQTKPVGKNKTVFFRRTKRFGI